MGRRRLHARGEAALDDPVGRRTVLADLLSPEEGVRLLAALRSGLRPVAKSSPAKASRGGRKTAYRYPDGRERFSLDGRIPKDATPLQQHVVRSGEVAPGPTLEQTRDAVARTLAALPGRTRAVSDGSADQTVTEEVLP